MYKLSITLFAALAVLFSGCGVVIVTAPRLETEPTVVAVRPQPKPQPRVIQPRVQERTSTTVIRKVDPEAVKITPPNGLTIASGAKYTAQGDCPVKYHIIGTLRERIRNRTQYSAYIALKNFGRQTVKSIDLEYDTGRNSAPVMKKVSISENEEVLVSITLSRGNKLNNIKINRIVFTTSPYYWPSTIYQLSSRELRGLRWNRTQFPGIEFSFVKVEPLKNSKVRGAMGAVFAVKNGSGRDIMNISGEVTFKNRIGRTIALKWSIDDSINIVPRGQTMAVTIPVALTNMKDRSSVGLKLTAMNGSRRTAPVQPAPRERKGRERTPAPAPAPRRDVRTPAPAPRDVRRPATPVTPAPRDVRRTPATPEPRQVGAGHNITEPAHGDAGRGRDHERGYEKPKPAPAAPGRRVGRGGPAPIGVPASAPKKSAAQAWGELMKSIGKVPGLHTAKTPAGKAARMKAQKNVIPQAEAFIKDYPASTSRIHARSFLMNAYEDNAMWDKAVQNADALKAETIVSPNVKAEMLGRKAKALKKLGKMDAAWGALKELKGRKDGMSRMLASTIELDLRKLAKGSMLPEFSGKAFDGRALSKSMMRNKVLLVHFMNNTNAGEAAALAQIQKLADGYGIHGLAVLCVNTSGTAKNAIQNFYNSKGVKVPVVHESAQNGVAFNFGLGQREDFPECMLFGKNGKMVASGLKGPALDAAVKGQFRGKKPKGENQLKPRNNPSRGRRPRR